MSGRERKSGGEEAAELGTGSIAQRVTLKQLRAFVTTASHGSFTRAGLALGLSQPALTAAIRQLEETVEVQLLERTKRRVALTSHGEEFLPIAERILADFSFAIEDLHGMARRRRERVGVSSVFSIAISILPGVIPGFARDFPQLRIQLRDNHSAGVCRQVRRNEVDFGFASRDADDPELGFRRLLRDQMGVVASRRHPLMSVERTLRWRDLEDYDFLGWAASTGPWLALQAVGGIPGSVRAPRIELNNIPTLEAMLESEVGVTSMPALAFPPDGRRGELRYRPLVEPVVMRDLYLVTRRGRAMAPAGRELLARIIEAIAERAGPSELIQLDDGVRAAAAASH